MARRDYVSRVFLLFILVQSIVISQEPFRGTETPGFVIVTDTTTNAGIANWKPAEGPTTEQPTLVIALGDDGTEEIDENVSTASRDEEGTEKIDEDTTQCATCATTVCSTEECWCQILGIEVLGTRRVYNVTTLYTVVCERLSGPSQCLLEHQRQAASKSDVVVTCNEWGGYENPQCHPEGYCFCVDELGMEVAGTRQTWPTPDVECHGLVGLVQEKSVSDELYSSQPCIAAQSRQLSAQRLTSHFLYIVQCDSNGDFVREQCDNTLCWCVDQIGSRVQATDHQRYGEYSMMCSTTTESHCINNMIWKEHQTACSATCEVPAPDCIGDLARCACPLSQPLLYNQTCITLTECHQMKQPVDCPISGMSHVECGCQVTCDIPICSGCRSICVCDQNKALLDGQCVEIEECPPLIDTSGCDNGMQFELCGDPCPMTCRDPFPECGGTCVEGCYCPIERPLLHNGKCVSDCPKDDLTPCQYERIRSIYPEMNSNQPITAQNNDHMTSLHQSEASVTQGLPSRCSKDGSYLPLQCSWEECWCVTLSGTRVATVGYAMDDSVCDDIERKVERECNKTMCWCLNTKGKEVPGTHYPLSSDIVCEEKNGKVIYTTKCARESCQWIDPLQKKSCSTPLCDSDGAYLPTQCNKTICWCVNETGDPVPDSHRSSKIGLKCPTPITQCEVTERDMVTMVTCDSLGRYAPRVCSGSECWCVDDVGVEIMGSRGHLSIVKCSKRAGFCHTAREVFSWEEFPFIGAQYPKCNSAGNYIRKQYKDGVYSCVDEISGRELAENAGGGSGCGVMECKEQGRSVYLDYFDENIVLDVEELQSCYCQQGWCHDQCYRQQIEYTIEVEGYMMVIRLPLCSSNGLYFPRQCMGDPWLSDSCYCVYTESGEEIPNTRGPFNNLPCPNTGIGQALYSSLTLPACLKTILERATGARSVRDYFSCDNGLYTARQCRYESCGCVAMDTGIPLLTRMFPSNSTQSCTEVLESPCLRGRSDECYRDELVLSANCTAMTCTDDGHHSPLQCTNDLCYCVDVVSGEEVSFTHGTRGMFQCSVEGVVEEDARTKCEIERDQRCGAEYHYSVDSEDSEDSEFECRVDECNTEDGNYLPKQCWGETCYCVNITTGTRINNENGYRKDVIICTEDGEMIFSNLTKCQIEELKNCSKVFYEEIGLYFRPLTCPQPLCTANGLYNPNSCEGDICNCVNVTNGGVIQGTQHEFGKEICTISGSLAPDSRRQCELDRARLCEPLSQTFHIPPDCTALYCTETGLFNPLQCNEQSCWCCDVESGVEYKGTSGEKGTFDCDYKGNIIDIYTPTSCSNQSALACDGYFYRRIQCNEEYCFCVFIDTGLTVKQTETVLGRPNCQVLLDRRGPCQSTFDEECPLIFQNGRFQLLEGCYNDECDVTGFYLTMHCSSTTCRCVNRTTGATLPNTEGLVGTFYCTNESIPVTIPPCRRQKELKCTEEGLFSPLQCHFNMTENEPITSQYTDHMTEHQPITALNVDQCYCVYTDSGDRILQSEQVTECLVVYDRRGPCVKQLERSCKAGCLKCDDEGNYQVQQCIDDVCFCTDHMTGNFLENTMTTDSSLHCSEVGELVGYTPCTHQDHLECSYTDRYHPKQCVSRFCYCVFVDSGVEIAGSRSFDRYMNCNKTFDTRTVCQKEGECGYIINAERTAFVAPEDCTNIRCEEDGSYSLISCVDQKSYDCTDQGDYEPHQCMGNICFCVNITTGHVFPKTISNGGTFYCSVDGKKLSKTHCQNQTRYTCDVQGYYEALQCEDGECECVFMDTGELNYRAEPCHQSFDNRTTCQRLQDEQCVRDSVNGRYVERVGCQGIKCRNDGSFTSKQCSVMEFEESCYCIDRWTGHIGDRSGTREIEYRLGTGGTGGTAGTREQEEDELLNQVTEFNCTDTGEMVILTKCRKQYVMNCTDEGSFVSQQVIDNMLVCVYNDSGDVIQGRQNKVEECEKRSDGRTKCQVEMDHMCPFVMDDQGTFVRAVSCSALTCSNDGSYSPQQCPATTCYCVHSSTGHRISHHHGNKSTFRCEDDGTFVQLSTCQMQSVLTCDEEGGFEEEQCVGTVCYCVYTDTGDMVHGEGIRGDCHAIQDNRTLCETTLDTLCPRTPGKDKECDGVSCDVDGTFYAQQCKENNCHCVNVSTGELMPGTEGPYDTFICTISGESLPLTNCRRQSVFLCTKEGSYSNKQFDGVHYFCVYSDTGYKILDQLDSTTHLSSPRQQDSTMCPTLLDLRSKCELERDLSCDDCGRLSCDEDGSYSAMQCTMTKCYCVNVTTGEETNDTRFRPGTYWCDETGARPITICKSQSLLECDNEGNFIPTQCNSHFCYCVYIDTGDTIEDTEALSDLLCEAKREDRTECKIKQYKSCPKYLIPGRAEIWSLADCVRTRCDRKDLFYPMRCLGDTCFCTDIHTGELVTGTMGPKGTFTCSINGLKLYPTVCEERRITFCDSYFDEELYRFVVDEPCLQYKCDDRGLFRTKQCIDQLFCWCVEPESGDDTPDSQGVECSISCTS